MKACGWCGRVPYAGKYSMLYRNFRQVPVAPGEVPPAIASNPVALANLAHGDVVDTYHCCSSCQRLQYRRSRLVFQPPATLAEVEALRSIYQLDAGLPLMLGVIKCGVRIASRVNGFLMAEPFNNLPLIGTIITYDATSGYEPDEMAEMLQQCLQQQLKLGWSWARDSTSTSRRCIDRPWTSGSCCF